MEVDPEDFSEPNSKRKAVQNGGEVGKGIADQNQTFMHILQTHFRSCSERSTDAFEAETPSVNVGRPGRDTRMDIG